MKALALTAALLAAAPAFAQEQQLKPPTAAEMQQMMALLAPGPEHKDFEPLAGTWDMSIAFNMGGPTMTFTGRAVNSLILGGRFLKSESTSKDPASGMEVESLSIYGFDRRTSEFTIVGYDTFGTYYVTAAGTKAPGAKDVVMRGEVEEHGGVKKYDMVLRWVDANTYVSEIVFHLPEGDLKVAETTYRRVR
ncbi:MAG: DUF1579 domain-containing protein [Acidobacteriota bacterium]|nr:DUF1579 domain-containing protein [Acidobacteriota bacterium]